MHLHDTIKSLTPSLTKYQVHHIPRDVSSPFCPYRHRLNFGFMFYFDFNLGFDKDSTIGVHQLFAHLGFWGLMLIVFWFVIWGSYGFWIRGLDLGLETMIVDDIKGWPMWRFHVEVRELLGKCWVEHVTRVIGKYSRIFNLAYWIV